MKRFVGFLSVVFLLGCSGGNSTGSLVFAAKDLTLLGNPSIIGESTGTVDNPSGFISVGGAVESQSGLALTDLKVLVRVLGANGAVLGSREEACNPRDIGPGGSCTFITGVALDSVDFRASRAIEITPESAQGVGTLRSIAVEWGDQ